jgi:hypothetical protein
VFLSFGLMALVTAIITIVFATETKKRLLEQVSP